MELTKQKVRIGKECLEEKPFGVCDFPVADEVHFPPLFHLLAPASVSCTTLPIFVCDSMYLVAILSLMKIFARAVNDDS